MTCPCALSLATPVALATAMGQLQRQGFLVRSAHALQSLAAVNKVLLDKTGTLTTGKLRLVEVDQVANDPCFDTAQILDIVTALEQGCHHPIARAFSQRVSHKQAERLDYHVGEGVSGFVDGERYALGKRAFVSKIFALEPFESALLDSEPDTKPDSKAGEASYQVEVILARQQGPIARIVLADTLRPGVKPVLESLAAKGLPVMLLSGDQEKNVAALAGELGIKQWRGEVLPEEKLKEIRRCQNEGDVVLMVGDGINDVPVLSGADVSVAVGESTHFTRLACDAVLLSGDLKTLLKAMSVAQKTARVIRQNLCWALIYNLSVLPFAALGWIPPWAAAIGMSASSLLVVINAMRLQGDRLEFSQESSDAEQVLGSRKAGLGKTGSAKTDSEQVRV